MRHPLSKNLSASPAANVAWAFDKSRRKGQRLILCMCAQLQIGAGAQFPFDQLPHDVALSVFAIVHKGAFAKMRYCT
ncbi:exported hypothetical protein [Mesorhizobium metallidurans STM 2683]|uniref:Uncharacterized protein n=1 Tax=Mesorhizobium metallidurans STM 2683 TaxID=1297569 RepID=M5EWS3_9HYPH|nr:exported hypothetical protein [Mesorhizobium metallidurans STM 2683]